MKGQIQEKMKILSKKLYEFKDSMAELWKESNDMLKIGSSFYVLGCSLRSAGAFWISHNYNILRGYIASQGSEIFSDPKVYQTLVEIDRGGSFYEVGGFVVALSLIPIGIGIGIEAYKTWKALKKNSK